MNVLFVLFTINAVISTVSADEDEASPCDDMANNIFVVLKKLTSFLTPNEIISQIYSEAFRPFFFGNVSKCTVQYLKLPHELKVCEKLAHVMVDKPEDVETSNIKFFSSYIENRLYGMYQVDADEVCALIPTEGEKFLQKVKDLINKKTTLDHFCKANKGVRRCKVTDDKYKKFIAYISYGYNPTFEPFVDMVIHGRNLTDSIFHVLRSGTSDEIMKDLKSCVNELFNYLIIAKLNAKHD